MNPTPYRHVKWNPRLRFSRRKLAYAYSVTLLLTLAAVFLGSSAGIGTYTFVYARGASYLTNDPMACANCHIMNPHLDAWRKSSHRAVATCNDCHAPHTNLIHTYWIKGVNGFNHSLAFTTGNFHEPLMINEMNRRVTENACRQCHDTVIHQIEMLPRPDGRMDCIRCHGDVGHSI